MHTLIKIFFIIIFGQMVQAQADAQSSITVKINNLDNDMGKVYVAIYSSKASFLENSYQSKATLIKNKSCEVIFTDIPEGVYAISFFHDENNNGKMDSNFLGIPKEDYGCSNNATGFMGPPRWEDAKFEFKQKSITQTITL